MNHRKLTVVLFVVLLLAGRAWAHTDDVNLVLELSENPVTAGTTVTIAGTITYATANHATAESPVAQNISVEQNQLDGVPVACRTAGSDFVSIRDFATAQNGQVTYKFGTKDLGGGGKKIGLRLHHHAEGGAHGTSEKKSACVDLKVDEAVTANPCSPNPCQHSGICETTHTGYFCQCRPDWIGENCDTCDQHPCSDRPDYYTDRYNVCIAGGNSEDYCSGWVGCNGSLTINGVEKQFHYTPKCF